MIGHEESQTVTKAFRKAGFEAYSCDLLPCSGGHPEWHLQMDIFKAVEMMKPTFLGMHPECTRLTVAANKYYKPEYAERFPNIHKDREEAVKHFMECAETLQKVGMGYIENPIGIMSRLYRKPDQIVQPYYFGDAERKATCLWLAGVPKLTPTKMVEPDIIVHKSGRTDSRLHFETFKLPKEERRKARSKTFQGLADAMVNQWADVISGNRKKCTFEGLVSSEKSGVHELMEFRIKNKAILKKSMAFAVRVLSIMRERNISREELAGAISVSPEELSEILKGRENLTLETITKIETFFSEDIFQIKKTERL